MIPYGKQDISQTDIDSVVSVLQSDFLTQGPMVPLFEQAVTDYCGAQHADSYSGLHLYVIRLKLTDIDKTHLQTFEALRDAGIGVNLHYIPVHRQPYYESLGFKLGYCPEGERYYAEAISLPMYPGLTDEQHENVVNNLRKVITQ